MGVFYISTFIDRADKLFKGTATPQMLVDYFWYVTPQYVYYVIPLAVLLATLITIAVLTRNSELIVMKACGVSLYRMAAADVRLRHCSRPARSTCWTGPSSGPISNGRAAAPSDEWPGDGTAQPVEFWVGSGHAATTSTYFRDVRPGRHIKLTGRRPGMSSRAA